MKNIIVFLPNSTIGGAEQHLLMVSSYSKSKYNVEVVIFHLNDEQAYDKISKQFNVKVFSSNSILIGVLKFIFISLFKVKKEYEYIYTSHVFINGLIGLLVYLKIIKKKYFVARESTSVFKRYKGKKLFFYKIFYWLGYESVDLLICQSEIMKEQLVSSMPKITERIKISVIQNPFKGVNLDVTNDINFQIQNHGNYIVSAGRLIYEKGFDILIDSFLKLKQNRNNDLKLIILGEGVERVVLINKIKELNLENDVILYGYVENVYPFFKFAKLCVVSSRIEGFPNVLLQMMSQNSKVVSTNCAGGINKIEGIYVSETSNNEDLFRTIECCLNSNTEINRSKFDSFLKLRSIEDFILNVEKNLN